MEMIRRLHNGGYIITPKCNLILVNHKFERGVKTLFPVSLETWIIKRSIIPQKADNDYPYIIRNQDKGGFPL